MDLRYPGSSLAGGERGLVGGDRGLPAAPRRAERGARERGLRSLGVGDAEIDGERRASTTGVLRRRRRRFTLGVESLAAGWRLLSACTIASAAAATSGWELLSPAAPWVGWSTAWGGAG